MPWPFASEKPPAEPVRFQISSAVGPLPHSAGPCSSPSAWKIAAARCPTCARGSKALPRLLAVLHTPGDMQGAHAEPVGSAEGATFQTSALPGEGSSASQPATALGPHTKEPSCPRSLRCPSPSVEDSPLVAAALPPQATVFPAPALSLLRMEETRHAVTSESSCLQCVQHSSRNPRRRAASAGRAAPRPCHRKAVASKRLNVWCDSPPRHSCAGCLKPRPLHKGQHPQYGHLIIIAAAL
mmetsp:Transcript_63973/g.187126  ORF Transcript_63973/g.187126 Transcript_63973/m.187126 type:complete len:240 (+) Transcript_63973:635-1354(+)